MVKFAWTNNLSVGNSIIDAEHRNLISMANDIAHAIETRDCSALTQEYELFENWLTVHFENEERIAQAIGFDFTHHRLAHQHLLKELQHLKDGLAAKNGTLPDSEKNIYSHFLRELLTGHVINEDMQLKPVLQSHPYDFKYG